jgi:hypothetical protein
VAIERGGPTPGFDPERHIAHVPVARFVELDCDYCLRGLEARGIRVVRSKGSSAIDLARNIRASEALRSGLESILFIDSDILFEPADAVSLLRSPEPVIAGAYAAKKLGNGQLNIDFGPGVAEVRIGTWATEPVAVRSVGAGFLRIKVAVLRALAKRLALPYCRMGGDRYGWPFFMPLVVREDGEDRYLCEDYAFCYRLRQIGITPKVDTSFRVYHLGDYAYGIEEAAGHYLERSKNVLYQVRPQPPPDRKRATPPEL